MFNKYQLFSGSMIGASLLASIALAAAPEQGPPRPTPQDIKQAMKSAQQTPIELTPAAFNPYGDPSDTRPVIDEGGIAGCGSCTDSENEPSCAIPDTVNGGCNSTPPVFSNITLGQSVCGATWANTANRDTDWWQFTITQTTQVTWTVVGNFTPLVGFIATPCPQSAFIQSVVGTACTPTTLTRILEPGTYVAFVANSAFVNIPCPSQYDATLTGNPAGACCTSATSCTVATSAGCTTLGGTYQGDGSVCPAAFATCANPLEDISATGTLSTVTGTDDNSQTGVPIGFTFNHFGNPFTTITINNNGFLTFDAIGNGFFGNATIPNTAAPNNLIAPLWDDLDSRVQGSVRYQTLTGPDRFIVQWTDMQRFPTTGGPNTFQAILYQTGNIEFRYGVLEGTPPLSASTGIENATGTTGYSLPSASLGTGNTCRTFSGPPQCGAACTADIAGNDNTVDVNDLLAVINAWGACPAPCPPSCTADIDPDGGNCVVDVNDLLDIINAWGPCP